MILSVDIGLMMIISLCEVGNVNKNHALCKPEHQINKFYKLQNGIFPVAIGNFTRILLSMHAEKFSESLFLHTNIVADKLDL